MNRPSAGAPFVTRAGLVQLLCAAVGLVVGLALSQVRGGPTVDGGRLAGLLFTLNDP